MNHDDNQHDLIHLTDLAIDWQFDTTNTTRRTPFLDLCAKLLVARGKRGRTPGRASTEETEKRTDGKPL